MDTTTIERPDRLAYAPDEVADLLSLSEPTIYRMLRSGELPSIKIGRSRRITRDDLDAYLDARPRV